MYDWNVLTDVRLEDSDYFGLDLYLTNKGKMEEKDWAMGFTKSPVRMLA